jgi:hypothetical protein
MLGGHLAAANAQQLPAWQDVGQAAFRQNMLSDKTPASSCTWPASSFLKPQLLFEQEMKKFA